MTKTFLSWSLALAFCTATQAATINTTLTVSGSGTTNITGSTTATGQASLSNIGPGTITATVSLTAISGTNLSVPFTVTLSDGSGSLTGTVLVPLSAVTAIIFSPTGSGSISGSATVTSGTGTYAGATGSFPTLTGSITVSTTFSLSLSGSGTITTTGGTTGPPTPTISTVQNNYGLIAPGLPNFALAPSTLFLIKGTNLANTTTALLSSASPGLSTTLSGVTVSVISGSTTLPCPLYYLSPTQIDAVLPGGTPVGAATIKVENNGGTSAAFQITVAQSAFGILNYNGTLGAVYDANNNILTSTNAANPGQAVVLWGSGVGSDPNADDKLYPQPQDNLTNIPMQAFVGGVQAVIAYRGRSQFPGVDQIVLTLPASVPTGCYTSLSIVSGNIVSNSVTIPVAATGKTCSDSSALPPDLLLNLSGKTTIKQGFLGISQSTNISSSSTTTTAGVFGSFQSVSGLTNSGGANQVSIGSCLVYTSAAGSTSTPTTTGLDAGSSIAVNGPGGSATLTPLSVPGAPLGLYSTSNGTVPPGFVPAAGGTFTFDNGSGGKDVQHFNASLTMPGTFTWTNAGSISSVSRSQGVTVNWTGGTTGTYVNISGGAAATVAGSSVTVTFTCQAPASAGTFAVPVPVLLALPAGNGSLSVGNYSNFQTFGAPGLDLGLVSASALTSKTLAYN